MSRKPGDWDCPQCGDLQFAKNANCRKCGAPNPDPTKSQKEMAAGIKAGFGGAVPKEGDWFCPACGDLQFQKNAMCRKCGAPNPTGGGMMGGGMMGAPMMAFGGGSSSPMMQGDWTCPQCGDHQFARNTSCRQCGASKPGGPKPKTKPGDWFCPQCNDLNFAKNTECRKCGTPNPDPESSLALLEAGIAAGFGGNEEKPGDWYCPGCGDLQFARNKACRKCQTPNPDPAASQAALAAGSPASQAQVQKKPGDWHCSNCGDLQFAKNMNCRKCGTPNFQALAANLGKGKGKGKGSGMNMMAGKGGCMNKTAGKGGCMNMMASMMAQMEIMTQLKGGGKVGKNVGKKRKVCALYAEGSNCYDLHDEP